MFLVLYTSHTFSRLATCISTSSRSLMSPSISMFNFLFLFVNLINGLTHVKNIRLQQLACLIGLVPSNSLLLSVVNGISLVSDEERASSSVIILSLIGVYSPTYSDRQSLIYSSFSSIGMFSCSNDFSRTSSTEYSTHLSKTSSPFT